MENIERAKTDKHYLGDLLLVNENLIWHSIHKYVGKPETLSTKYCIEKDDMLQLGRIGFIKAIHAFDTSRGNKFSSFSVTAIVREVRCFLRDSANIVRPTRTANELMHQIHRLENELGYRPATPEIADVLNVKEEQVTKALCVGQPVKYLDEPLKQAAEDMFRATAADYLEDDLNIEHFVVDKVYTDSIIDSIRNRLTETELRVLKLRVSGLNQTQTAETENLSQMRVNRIMKKAATHLKHTPKG
ncbi:sigma-70 family RNA polymerase sigma factor [Paenibacillus sp. NPDC058071]|uniref:sigma-70 family RNA polymerase sigma factor n=1 Tax=Paenibacillus sp. NPDC058071 TaxID=3346326 RepID=UPI0036D7998C